MTQLAEFQEAAFKSKLAQKLSKGQAKAAKQANKSAQIEALSPDFVDPLDGNVLPFLGLALAGVVVLVIVGSRKR